MPNTRSAKKALRQAKTRTETNRKAKKTYKKALNEYRKLVLTKDTEGAQKVLPTLYKALDKAAKTKVIKVNKASRLKSRAAHLLSPKAA
jgi:ribosomal protein S20